MKLWMFVMLLASLGLWGAALNPVRASGPSLFTADGRPYRLDPEKPARLVVDAGPFGARSHAQGVALAERAFRTWEGVPTARLQFELAGELPQDIDGHNVMPFLNQLKDGEPSPILFDSDGSIMNLLFGEEAVKDLFGVHIRWWGEPRDARFTLSVLVMNGPALSNWPDDYAAQLFTHELGHFVGLDHSQLNPGVSVDGDPTNDDLVPVMTYSYGANVRTGLHREDEAWFSWLYPTPDFPAQTGSIQGRVLLPDRQTGLMGVMVVARRVGDPRVTAVSGVSGYRFGGADSVPRNPGRPGDVRGGWWPLGGVYDLARLGEFLIPGLPPGSYTLELQQIVDVPSEHRQGFLIGGPKYWREGSSAQDLPGASTSIVVNAGQEVTGVDIVVNGQDLGEPQSAAEQEPNPWYQPQAVRLPAVIEGAVEDSASAVSLTPGNVEQFHDVYRVRLREWTMVTAILSAERPAADLDLYRLRLDQGTYEIEAQAIAPGTPPEILQERLAPGDYLFGVYHSGGPGSAYTLRLLATPAPELARAEEVLDLEYEIIRDITETSAVVHWRLANAGPAVLTYGQPFREVGSTQPAREHTMTLTGLPSASVVPVWVTTGRVTEARTIRTTFTTAKAAAPDGTPRIKVSRYTSGVFSGLGGQENVWAAGARLINEGDGEALNVRIESVTVAPGWALLSEALHGTGLPPTLEMGRLGAGAESSFGVTMVRRYGATDPWIRIHGSYTDAGGTVRKF